MHNLGDTYRELGRNEEEIVMKEKALKFRRSCMPQHHPDIGSSCFSLSISYLQMGNLNRAIEFAREGLLIWQAALPSSHPNIATALQLVAQIEQLMCVRP